jgi:hypothetical protein
LFITPLIQTKLFGLAFNSVIRRNRLPLGDQFVALLLEVLDNFLGIADLITNPLGIERDLHDSPQCESHHGRADSYRKNEAKIGAS